MIQCDGQAASAARMNFSLASGSVVWLMGSFFCVFLILSAFPIFLCLRGSCTGFGAAERQGEECEREKDARDAGRAQGRYVAQADGEDAIDRIEEKSAARREEKTADEEENKTEAQAQNLPFEVPRFGLDEF